MSTHSGITCSSCHVCPIVGTRWKCLTVTSDFCNTCKEKASYEKNKKYLKIDRHINDGGTFCRSKGLLCGDCTEKQVIRQYGDCMRCRCVMPYFDCTLCGECSKELSVCFICADPLLKKIS